MGAAGGASCKGLLRRVWRTLSGDLPPTGTAIAPTVPAGRSRGLIAPQGPIPMLSLAIAFLVLALVAAVFGFGGIAAGAAGIAKILFFVFLVLFLLSLLFRRPAVR